MSGRRLILPVACCAALAAAALLVALARGTAAAEAELADLERAEARLAVAAEQPSRGPATRLAEAILATADDRSYRQAVGLIERGSRPNRVRLDALAENAEAIARLVPLAGSGPEPRRSQAAALIGTLYFDNALVDLDGSARWVQQAVEAFALAATLDPGNAEAKRNLELLLSLQRGSGTGSGGEEGTGGTSGAGENPTGSGY